MTIGFIAIHYPHPEHREDFIERVQSAAATMRPTPGCLSATCWVTTDGTAVISTAYWQSEQARTSSFATAHAAGVDFAFDEREIQPRHTLHLKAP